MKNFIKIIILSVFTLFIGQAHGQMSRSIDLATNCLSPKTNSYFTTPAYFDVEFSLINYGPDTILSVDSVSINLRFVCSSSNYYDSNFNYLYPLNTDILPGDSIILTKTIVIDSMFFFDLSFYLTSNAWLVNRSIGSNYFLGEMAGMQGVNRDNNFWTIKMNHRSVISSVESVGNPLQGYSFYPNPVNDILTIQYDNISQAPQRIELTDINGRCVISQQVNQTDYLSNKTIQMVIPSYLQDGVYFLKLYVDDIPTFQKIIIQR